MDRMALVDSHGDRRRIALSVVARLVPGVCHGRVGANVGRCHFRRFHQLHAGDPHDRCLDPVPHLGYAGNRHAPPESPRAVVARSVHSQDACPRRARLRFGDCRRAVRPASGHCNRNGDARGHDRTGSRRHVALCRNPRPRSRFAAVPWSLAIGGPTGVRRRGGGVVRSRWHRHRGDRCRRVCSGPASPGSACS